jgi:hypothetical protein
LENKKELKELSIAVPVLDPKGAVQKEISTDQLKLPVKGQKGRPKKSQITAKKKGSRGAVGRPAGDAARIAEFKARLLGTAGDKIIRTLIEKALDPNDKDQIAALKMCVDRVLPMSAFDPKAGNGTIPQISINITGLTSPSVEADVIEMGTVDES